jgi:hypothetical protein
MNQEVIYVTPNYFGYSIFVNISGCYKITLILIVEPEIESVLILLDFFRFFCQPVDKN